MPSSFSSLDSGAPRPYRRKYGKAHHWYRFIDTIAGPFVHYRDILRDRAQEKIIVVKYDQIAKSVLEPPPVVKRRKPSLTVPLDDKERGQFLSRRKYFDQEQSAVMRLPKEIRLLVWEAYVGRENIYILLTHKRLEAFHTNTETAEPVERLGEIREHVRENIDKRAREERKNVNILPLLQTCRAIYSEAIKVVYRSSPFTFCDVLSFISFSSSLLPHRFHQTGSIFLDFSNLWPNGVVHELELAPKGVPDDSGSYYGWDSINNDIDYSRMKNTKVRFYHHLPQVGVEDIRTTWDMACKMLLRMEGLKELTIIVDRSRYQCRAKTVEEELMESLKPILEGGLKRFDLRVDQSDAPLSELDSET